MDPINSNLFLTLEQDLKLLNKITLKISCKLENFELNSWLFPLRSYKDIEGTPEESHKVGNIYTTYLELIIDRLYIIINAVTIFIQKMPNFPLELKRQRNVAKPKNLTLGTSTGILWETLYELQTREAKTKTVNIYNKIFANSAVQTTGNSEISCQICSTTMLSMKALIEKIETNITDSSTKRIRETIIEEIYEISQSNCVNLFVNAVNKDVSKVVKKLEEYGNENLIVKRELLELEAKFKEMCVKLKHCEQKCRYYEKITEKDKNKIRQLLRQAYVLHRKITNSNNTISEQNNKIKEMEQDLQENLRNSKALENVNNVLKQRIRRAHENTDELSQEKEQWMSKFKYLESEVHLLKENISNTELLCLELDSVIDINWDKVEKRIKKCDDVVVTLTSQTDDLIKKNKGAFKLNNISLNTLKKIEVKGDPVTDITRHIETNKENIKIIEEENDSLLNLIRRLKNLMPSWK